MVWTVGLAAAAQAVAAGAFVGAGLAVATRPVAAPLRPAQQSFVAWWFLIGAYTASEALATILSAGPGLAGGEALLFHASQLGLIHAACVGLVQYVLFLQTGTTRWFPWVRVYYILLVVAFLAAAVRHGPIAYDIPDWWVQQRYVGGIPGWEYLLLWTALRAPVIVFTAGYVALLRHKLDAEQRRRILLVGGSIISWFAGGLVVRYTGSGPTLFVALVGLGMASAVCVAAAYAARRA